MKINADLTQKAIDHAKKKEWIASPSPGVFRKMLDRDGEEVARATSLVLYHPDSHFPRHTHGGGEEFLVLEGVFSDEHADYPAGTYVRNPIGSSHEPFVKPGCVILVKLRQMTDTTEVCHLCLEKISSGDRIWRIFVLTAFSFFTSSCLPPFSVAPRGR